MKIDIKKYEEFIKETKTPFYIYDSQVIKNQYNSLKEKLPNIIDVFFSMKANPNINIVRFLNTLGSGIEIASIGELKASLAMGVDPKRIVFAGPAKSIEGLTMAIKKQIFAINVESINELQKVEKICKELNLTQNVNLRINPLFTVDESILQMGGGAMKFGIDEEQIPNFTEVFSSLECVKIKGLHIFAATQVLNEALIGDYFEKVFKLTRKLEGQLDTKFETIDVGSGFGIDYLHNGKVLDMASLGEQLNEILEKNVDFINRQNFKIILESGRYLVGESGAYITQVIDRKTSREKNFVLVKGGINHLLRPALIQQNHYIETFKDTKEVTETVSIGGQLCTGVDFFAKDIEMPKLELDDYIAILEAGAYGYSESMLYFLSHEFPAEYLVINGAIKKIRKEKTANEIIAEQINLNI
jgi:diaminopimelate decarboxylase